MKILFKFVLILFCLFNALSLISQDANIPASKSRKGTLYLYWGWNREAYTPSDIQFTGNDYNFTLQNVKAYDRQSPINFDTYFHPSKLTIPQYNFRLGYFINEHYNISFGVDHMKYVVKRGQTVKISGKIDDELTNYSGIYHDDDIKLKSDFLRLEHTDGLNFINFDIRRVHDLYTYKMISLSATAGLGAGILYPRTDATLLGKPRHDEFHVSGYGISSMVGLNFKFWKYFFIQTECKGGWINLPDILTTYESADRAKQKFFFGQVNILFGGNIYL